MDRKTFGVTLCCLFAGVAVTGCAGMRTTQKAENDPARDLNIVQMTSNFLPAAPGDPGTIALNARMETDKAGDSKYFLVVELTSVQKKQLQVDQPGELILRVDGHEHKLESAGSGTAMENVRSALFFQVDPDLLRKLGEASEAEMKLASKGTPIVKALSKNNLEEFRLFSEVNLPVVQER
ncbi:MAG: hypothetical protein ACO1QB_13815 [Verrucomicrobiales bacterium]